MAQITINQKKGAVWQQPLWQCNRFDLHFASG